MSKHDIPPEAHVTLQYQYRKCGKPQCGTCNKPESKGHGPYFYGYWKEKGKLHSVYYGKDDPRGTVKETAAALAKRGK